ncbi:MAG: YggS family pyridoxal phosphate-dependent enzyme [Clostridiales Family XIII bacterium]|jgi:pyridoxal phosphate enzyme (YggS family)|nr:YggS family pyridoxal phosphate-dependent enzyme [Clostridiales Family XIII bacterium]
MGDIGENIKSVRGEIARRAAAAGREAGDVVLVAVTKTYGPEAINEAVRNGVTDIGENKVQEILDKHGAVLPVNWHMIGHLQRNKVKYVIDKVKMIHSVDSFRLAEEIDRRAGQAGITMDILVQVNVAEEESKFGASAAEAAGLIGEILEKCGNIRVRGLMCMAPFAYDPEEARPYFRQAKAMFDELGKSSHERLDFRYLSMGMSGDFGVAVEEGASMVRVGTAIFGARG